MPVLLRTVIFTVLMPGSVTIWIPALLLSSGAAARWPDLGAFRWAGVIPLGLGVACFARCEWDFAFSGRGTPAPWDAPRLLVSGGLYRLVRNPMYVALLLILMGEAIVFGSAAIVLYASVVWMAFHSFVWLYEEPALRNRFGAAYEAYRGTVPRWLPRLPDRSRAVQGAEFRPAAASE
jgi:protein-S-isoprenylcysteine O-methyltransferase Ste14